MVTWYKWITVQLYSPFKELNEIWWLQWYRGIVGSGSGLVIAHCRHFRFLTDLCFFFFFWICFFLFLFFLISITFYLFYFILWKTRSFLFILKVLPLLHVHYAGFLPLWLMGKKEWDLITFFFFFCCHKSANFEQNYYTAEL